MRVPSPVPTLEVSRVEGSQAQSEMKTVFIVPKMFTGVELASVDASLPDDFQDKSKEFWDYVDEKLRTQLYVQKLYYDSLTKEDSEESLEFIKKNNEQCYNLVQKFRDGGAKLQATEDPLLLAETVSWVSMLKDNEETDLATEEMLAKNMMDRDKYIADKISESLKENETGILFLAPGRQVVNLLPSDIRVIKIQPFDPTDYVNSWLTTTALNKSEKEKSSQE